MSRKSRGQSIIDKCEANRRALGFGNAVIKALNRGTSKRKAATKPKSVPGIKLPPHPAGRLVYPKNTYESTKYWIDQESFDKQFPDAAENIDLLRAKEAKIVAPIIQEVPNV